MRTDLQLLGLMPDVDAVLAALAALDTLAQTYAGTSTEQQADPSFEEDAREQAVAIDGVISNLSLPLTIVFRGGGATANGVLLDADEDGVLARMARAAVVAQRPVWRLTEAPPASCWPAVARALNATQHGHAEPLQTVDAPGFERLPEPGSGDGAGLVEVGAALRVLASMDEIDEWLALGTRQPGWRQLSACVCRLSNALTTSPDATARALEIDTAPWTVSRRAVAATFRALAVMRNLGTSSLTEHAVAHTTLLLSARGLAERGARPLPEVAREVFEPLLAEDRTAPLPHPHRLRVITMVQQMADNPDPSSWRGVVRLVQLLYEVEAMRLPPGSEAQLTFGELLAWAAAEAGRKLDMPWVLALINTFGPAPVGARVSLADGRRGVVLSSRQGEPWKPVVLVERQVVTPDQPVRLV